jgi:hypothetical protein
MADVKRFSHKSDNCYSITPEQLVRDLLADMEAGKVNPDRIQILMVTKRQDGGEELEGWRSRMDRIEEIGYLSAYTHMKIDAL